jgi:hypothetical protein
MRARTQHNPREAVSVYIDSMFAAYRRMKMCHMVADTTDELLAMADRIGVQRKWIQNPGSPTEHFDVCQSKRAEALKLGAVDADRLTLVNVIRKKRAATPGKPTP